MGLLDSLRIYHLLDIIAPVSLMLRPMVLLFAVIILHLPFFSLSYGGYATVLILRVLESAPSLSKNLNTDCILLSVGAWVGVSYTVIQLSLKETQCVTQSCMTSVRLPYISSHDLSLSLCSGCGSTSSGVVQNVRYDKRRGTLTVNRYNVVDLHQPDYFGCLCNSSFQLHTSPSPYAGWATFLAYCIAVFFILEVPPNVNNES